MSVTQEQPETASGGGVCPQCGEPFMAGERYCESCGTDVLAPVAGQGPAEDPGVDAAADPPSTEPVTAELTAVRAEPEGPVARACATCGGRIAADGYCETCGAPAVRERDHWTEQPVPWVAAVCDRGIKHWRNEDAMAISAVPVPGELAALVVCDGVSSSSDSDLASLAAARAAREVLIRPATRSPSIAGRIRGWTDQLAVAAKAAQDAVLAVTTAQSDAGAEHRAPPAGHRSGAELSPPSCTFVAAIVDGPVIVAGWIGDSRAYWLPDDAPAEQLSVDDSWATEMISSGLTREQAEAAPQAHAITRWLGVDAPGFDPRCSTTIPNGPGWVLVCSDGLWNYCSAAPDVARLVQGFAAEAGGDPLQTADKLVDWANGRGGHDNITVALARLETTAQTADAGDPDSLEPDSSSSASGD